MVHCCNGVPMSISNVGQELPATITRIERMSDYFGALFRAWNRLSLTFRFALVTAGIIVAGMVIVGEWAARRIEEGIVSNHAAAAALYTDNYIADRVQELKTVKSLSAEAMGELDRILKPPFSDKNIVGFRIWRDDTIVYGERRELVGRQVPLTDARRRAYTGQVVAAYRRAEPSADTPKIAGEGWLLEIYAPVREVGSNLVIALAVTYEAAPALHDAMVQARIESYVLVLGIGAHMLLLQIIIVDSGSQTIARQRAALNRRIFELSATLNENSSLRQANRAGARVNFENERFLRQVGADLHDGPLQLLGIAILRLDSLHEMVEAGEKLNMKETASDIEDVRDCIRDSVLELRGIAAGLALPEIEKQTLPDVIRTAVSRHARRCGQPVDCTIDGPLPEVAAEVKVCVYRVIQEGLSNAFRHGGGVCQSVACASADGCVEVAVSDRGPGLKEPSGMTEAKGQGLIGLKDRIESLGGRFSIEDRRGGGVRLSARFEVAHAILEGGRT